MKNIAVLSILVIIIGTSTAKISAYCQNFNHETVNNEHEVNNIVQNSWKYSFSFAAQCGFVYGQVFELVYQGSKNDELLSELIWDMKPVHYMGAQIDFNRRDLMSKPGFFASASFKAGIPRDSGIMEDRDWMSKENKNLTHFSSHTNRTVEFYWLDVVLGASFPVKQYLYIKPFFSGSWMHLSFAGRDGYGKYARGKKYDASGNPIQDYSLYPEMFFPINDDPTYYPYEGKEVIRYKQDWILIAAGFNIGTKILNPFSFDLSFRISPFAYCNALDNHLINTPRTFMDSTYNGLYLEPGAAVSFTHDFFSFSLEAAYCYIGRTRGQSYSKSGNGDYNNNGNIGGASLSLLDIRFLVKVHI